HAGAQAEREPAARREQHAAPDAMGPALTSARVGVSNTARLIAHVCTFQTAPRALARVIGKAAKAVSGDEQRRRRRAHIVGDGRLSPRRSVSLVNPQRSSRNDAFPPAPTASASRGSR